ncbi:MAG: phosphatidylserine decarboxylase family protein [Prevotellaceae bacterium]|nr:phosphatidylserine decarboxylase family protein [Prevotellaceae bacterium]
MVNRLRKLRKIRFHREGTHILAWGAIVLILLNVVVMAVTDVFRLASPWNYVLVFAVLAVSVVVYVTMLNFFRCPLRSYPEDTKGVVVAPADGKVVVIEEVFENEYFRDRRLMVSIFMSLFDVHANWIPVDGTVKLVRHHNGNYHCAWLPKASIENERSTIVITTPEGEEILVRQIAGAVARRVITYLQEGESYELDEHLGFIKFGSRVDIFLPLGSKICVKLGQRTTGNITVIARLEQ